MRINKFRNLYENFLKIPFNPLVFNKLQYYSLFRKAKSCFDDIVMEKKY